MNLPIWHAISLMRETREPLAWWRHVLEGEFEKVRPMLAACEGLAGKVYPCPVTGILLEIHKRPEGYLAFPVGEHADDAPDIHLTWEEAQAWELDRRALRKALCEALGLLPAPAGSEAGGDVAFMGTCARHEARRRVYLCHVHDAAGAVRLAADAGQTADAGCLLFAQRQVAAEMILKTRGVAGVALAECLTWAGGKWQGECGDVCKGCRVEVNIEQLAVNGEAVSGRLRAKRAAAGRRRSVVYVPGDRKAIRVEVQRLVDGGLPHTEAYKQVAEQAQHGRAGQRKLTMKYDLTPEVATASVVRRVFESGR